MKIKTGEIIFMQFSNNAVNINKVDGYIRVFLRCFRDPNRVPRIRENYYRVPRIREIGSLQVHTRYL